MKKTFFNFGLFLALGLTIGVFNSCDKDEDDGNDGGTNGGASKITATNVINGSTQIKTVKTLAYWDNGDDWGDDVIAQAPYQNNGFVLELPATVEAKYLEPLDIDDMEGISISNKNVKALFLDDISAYNGDDDKIGYLYLEQRDDDNEHYTSWLYVDNDVTIKGEYKDIEDDSEDIGKVDLKLKKGWNVVYDSYTESYKNGKEVSTYSLTSQKPSGVNYTWNFYSYDSLLRGATKSIENAQSAFSKFKTR